MSLDLHRLVKYRGVRPAAPVNGDAKLEGHTAWWCIQPMQVIMYRMRVNLYFTLESRIFCHQCQLKSLLYTIQFRRQNYTF